MTAQGCDDDGNGESGSIDNMDADAGLDQDADTQNNAQVGQDGGGDSDITPDGGAQDECGALDSCADECVDLQGDSRHCGACGATCDDGDACVSGACVEAGFPCVDRWIGSVGDGVTLTDTTLGKGDDIDGLCLRSGADEDTVMFWQVPEGGDWQIRFASSDFDVVAKIELAAFPNLCRGNEVDCDDDGNGPNGALLSFTALEGQQTLISVDAFRNTGAGQFTMSFSRSGEPPVSNGACDNAQDLTAFGAGLNISAAFACYQSTCADAEDVGQCITECVPTLIPSMLSEGCAACFGDYIECAIDQCGAECLNGGNTCDDCDYDSQCGEPFSECTGL